MEEQHQDDESSSLFCWDEQEELFLSNSHTSIQPFDDLDEHDLEKCDVKKKEDPLACSQSAGMDGTGRTAETSRFRDELTLDGFSISNRRRCRGISMFWVVILGSICALIGVLVFVVVYFWFGSGSTTTTTRNETITTTKTTIWEANATRGSRDEVDVFDVSYTATARPTQRPIAPEDLETVDFPLEKPFVLRVEDSNQCITFVNNNGLVFEDCNYRPHQRFHYNATSQTLPIMVRIGTYDNQGELCLSDYEGIDACNGTDPRQHFQLDTNRHVFLHYWDEEAELPSGKYCVVNEGGLVSLADCSSSTASKVTVEEVPEELLPRRVTLQVSASSSSGLTVAQERQASSQQEQHNLCLTVDTFDPTLEIIQVEPCDAQTLGGDQTFVYWPVLGRLEIVANTGESRCLRASKGFTGSGAVSLDDCALESANDARRQAWFLEADTGRIHMEIHGDDNCAFYNTTTSETPQAEMLPCDDNDNEAETSWFTMVDAASTDTTISTPTSSSNRPLQFSNGTGPIRSLQGDLCLQRTERYVSVVMAQCDNTRWDQMFSYDLNTQQIYSGEDPSLCLDITQEGTSWEGTLIDRISLVPCQETGLWNPPQNGDGKMRSPETPVLCITSEAEPYNVFDWKHDQDGNHCRLQLEMCTDEAQDANRNARQQFVFPDLFWGQASSNDDTNLQTDWALQDNTPGALVHLSGSGGDKSWCVTYGVGATTALTMEYCTDPFRSNQLFTYDPESGQLQTSSGDCLQSIDTNVLVDECSNEASMIWNQDNDARLWVQDATEGKRCLEYKYSKFSLKTCGTGYEQKFLFRSNDNNVQATVAPTPPATDAPTQPDDTDLILPIDVCSTHLVTSDSNRDHQLSQKEYFVFVLSIYGEMYDPFTWPGDVGNFNKLPQEVQDEFVAFQQGGLLPVGRAKQGDVFEGETLVHVKAICYDVSHAIQDTMSPETTDKEEEEPETDDPTNAPTKAPVGMPTTSPTAMEFPTEPPTRDDDTRGTETFGQSIELVSAMVPTTQAPARDEPATEQAALGQSTEIEAATGGVASRPETDGTGGVVASRPDNNNSNGANTGGVASRPP